MTDARGVSSSGALQGAETRIVLVVDDDTSLLAALRRGLTLRGFTVAIARDAEEALAYYDREHVDLVVLDIGMPGMDGLSLLRLIRARDSVPVIILTARDSEADRAAGFEAGADDYLVKPFDFEELVGRIQALLENGGKKPR